MLSVMTWTCKCLISTARGENSYWASTGACWLPDLPNNVRACIILLVHMYNVVPGSSTGTTCMYSYACICMHTRTYVCVHVIIFISSTHLQGPLYIGYVIATSLIYQIKRHLYIFSLCLKFLNHTKESVPTLSNHISALIIDESHKNAV